MIAGVGSKTGVDLEDKASPSFGLGESKLKELESEELGVVELDVLAGSFSFAVVLLSYAMAPLGKFIWVIRNNKVSLRVFLISSHLGVKQRGKKVLSFSKQANYIIGYRAFRILIKRST